MSELKNKFKKPLDCPLCHVDKKLLALNPCRHWCCRDCITKSGIPKCPFCDTMLICTDKHLEEMRNIRINRMISFLSKKENKWEGIESRSQFLHEYYTDRRFRTEVKNKMNKS